MNDLLYVRSDGEMTVHPVGHEPTCVLCKGSLCWHPVEEFRKFTRYLWCDNHDCDQFNVLVVM